MERFKNFKSKQKIIHDRDLRRWACTKAAESANIIPNFNASKKWVHNFKVHNSIVSRKILKFVRKDYTTEAANIEKKANDFVRDSLARTQNYMPNVIFNTDQSGVAIDLRSGRTLDVIGEKQILKGVGSVAGTTHSYTIQPVISKDGDLLSPMFVCWQERRGMFGPRVKESIAALDLKNLYVVASSSGKLGKDLMLEWFENIYFPGAPLESFLYVDSWNCFNDRAAIAKVTPGNKILHILQMPPGTTPLIQPLDVYFFRTWKQYMRNIDDHVFLHDLPYEVISINNLPIELYILLYYLMSYNVIIPDASKRKCTEVVIAYS